MITEHLQWLRWNAFTDEFHDWLDILPSDKTSKKTTDLIGEFVFQKLYPLAQLSDSDEYDYLMNDFKIDVITTNRKKPYTTPEYEFRTVKADYSIRNNNCNTYFFINYLWKPKEVEILGWIDKKRYWDDLYSDMNYPITDLIEHEKYMVLDDLNTIRHGKMKPNDFTINKEIIEINIE